jgi:hypothetical protein
VGELTDIVGVQVAWWQLGFRGRRAVLWRSRYGGTGSGDEVGRAWARQVLLAPWWWRAARTAVAAGTALLVVVIAEIGLLPEIEDATVSVLLTVLLSLGVTAGLTWRQTRWAREIAGAAAEHAQPQAVLTQKLRLACALVLAVAALSVFLQSAADSVSDDVGCQRYGQPDPRFARSQALGGGGVGRCPGPIGEDAANGLSRYQEADGSFVYWIPTLGTTVHMTAAMRTAWLAHPSLGLPVEIDRPDGDDRYVNFAHGYVLDRPDQPPEVRTDGSQHEPAGPGETCVGPDRPCVTDASVDIAGGIEIAWKSPHADAYNVSYWIAGRSGTYTIEAAVPSFALPDPEPGATYGFQVQACVKHFLARSTCTPRSNSVAVQARP